MRQSTQLWPRWQAVKFTGSASVLTTDTDPGVDDISRTVTGEVTVPRWPFPGPFDLLEPGYEQWGMAYGVLRHGGGVYTYGCNPIVGVSGSDPNTLQMRVEVEMEPMPEPDGRMRGPADDTLMRIRGFITGPDADMVMPTTDYYTVTEGGTVITINDVGPDDIIVPLSALGAGTPLVFSGVSNFTRFDEEVPPSIPSRTFIKLVTMSVSIEFQV